MVRSRLHTILISSILVIKIYIYICLFKFHDTSYTLGTVIKHLFKQRKLVLISSGSKVQIIAEISEAGRIYLVTEMIKVLIVQPSC